MSIKEKNTTSNLYSTVSIAIVLFLLAIYGLLFLHASNITNLIKEKINIIVELKDETSPIEAERLLQFIEKMEGVKKESVEYIAKERAQELMKEFLSEFSETIDISPFKNVLTFNLNAVDYSEMRIDNVRQTLETDGRVLSVYSENETVNLVKDNVQNLSYITLLIGLVLVVLALAIVYNTIKLKLHSDRMEIKTMQLVGAKRVFIAKPYIREALRIATGAFFIVLSFVVVMMVMLFMGIPGIHEIVNWMYILLVLAGVYITGIVLTVGIARIVVKGYLDSNTHELV